LDHLAGISDQWQAPFLGELRQPSLFDIDQSIGGQAHSLKATLGSHRKGALNIRGCGVGDKKPLSGRHGARGERRFISSPYVQDHRLLQNGLKLPHVAAPWLVL
jgi:hypothetical protein